jgi:signal transduction histidine kinase
MFGLAQRMEADNRAIGRFLIGAIAIGFALLVAAVGAAALIAAENQRHVARVAHTYQVEVAIEHAQLLVEQAEATRRGYIIAGQQRYLDAYVGFERQVGPAVDRVAALTRDNPRQRAEMQTYRRVTAELIAARVRTVRLMRDGRRDEAWRVFVAEADVARPRQIRDSAARLLAEERRLLGLRDAEQQRSATIFYAIIVATGILLSLLVALTAVTVARFTRDLAASRDRLRSFNEALEAEVTARTADLTRANEEIQRFAYIVSHDLRSPLVNVMGFTAELSTATAPLGELVDRAEADAPHLLTEEAKLAAREDLPEAIAFIRTSTAKMDRLINAILKLSREGRRTIAPEPLDVAEIADGAVAALAHVADQRGVGIEVRRPMPQLVSDRLAVEQILSNLIENATKYLQPGRPGRIIVSGAVERGRVAVSVTDNGRGIDARDHSRVFDLFRRSGTQDQPGEGIGLAHVRALAYRLGGTIDLQSVLGEGSTFRLILPPTYQPPQQDARA